MVRFCKMSQGYKRILGIQTLLQENLKNLDITTENLRNLDITTENH